MFCMNCGQQLPDGAKFCLQCGTPQGEISPASAPAAEPQRQDNGPAFVPAMCPNCSAHLRVDPSQKIARCESCGTECLVQNAIKTLEVSGSVNVVHTGVVIHKQDHTGEPNFIVTFIAGDPAIDMSLKITPGPQKVVFKDGDTQRFNLAPGKYKIVANVGGFFQKINETVSKQVTITDPTKPVTVTVGIKSGMLRTAYISVV